MINPFKYGTVVTGEAFCNRKAELRDLRHAIENGEKLFVYSERRLGKTSLVRAAIDKLPQRKFIPIYIDLWPTDSEESFTTMTAKVISQTVGSTPKKMLDTAKSLFTQLVPNVSLDDAGKPTINFGVTAPRRKDVELEEVLKAPATIAARRKRRVVVVLDEIQRILEYEDDLVERKLRSIIQHQPDVCYLFLGGRKHLVRQMFLDKSRPLYRSAGHYPLGSIDEPHWIEFVRKRFVDADKTIDDATIRSACRLTEGHPFYTQYLFHVLWELGEPKTKLTDASIQTALRILLDRESHAYTMLWESLTAHQRRFLRGLAFEPRGVKPFSSAFTMRYGLRSASNAQRASQSLVQKDVIDPDNGSFVIVDRFFRLWIRNPRCGVDPVN